MATAFDIEDRIRDRAYALWEAAGRPEGQDKEFWRLAEKELAELGGLDQSQQDAEGDMRPPLPAGFPAH